MLRQQGANILVVIACIGSERCIPPGPAAERRIAADSTKTHLGQHAFALAAEVGDPVNPDLAVDIHGGSDADGMGDGVRPLQVGPADGRVRDAAGFIGVTALQPARVVHRDDDIVIPPGIDQPAVMIGGGGRLADILITAAHQLTAVDAVGFRAGSRRPTQVDRTVAFRCDGQVGYPVGRIHSTGLQHQHNPAAARYGIDDNLAAAVHSIDGLGQCIHQAAAHCQVTGNIQCGRLGGGVLIQNHHCRIRGCSSDAPTVGIQPVGVIH